jgi:hypothetical protein
MPVNDALASDTWQRYRYCTEFGHYSYLVKADKCEKFFAGLQWEQQDLDALQLQRRPALTINKVISTLSTIMGEQIYNRNETVFRPAGEGATSDIADALTKVYKNIAQNNQLSWVRSDVASDGFIRSRGFYDVRMDFSKNMRGDIRISQLNSKNVVIDPDAEEYDPDSWNDVFITKWLTAQDIELLYSKEDADYLKLREGSLFPYAYDSIERVRDRFAEQQLQMSYYGTLDTEFVRRNIRVLERQHHKLASQKHFVDRQTGDMRPIPEEWDREHIARVMQGAQGQIDVVNKKVKRVRWTVTADNVVLHDDWSPYKHFTPVPYFPIFRYGSTIGLVENLLGPQELFNKVSSQELHIVNTSANSGWITKAGNLVNMSNEELEQSGAETGLVLEVVDVEQTQKIKPNATPQGIDRITYKAEESMKNISGVSDSMQGMDREDVAAKAIAYKKQSGKTNMVWVMDNQQRSDFILARNVLDIVQEFYTEERLVHIVSSGVQAEAEQITVNQYDLATDEIVNDLTLGVYGVVVSSMPDRDTMEDSQFEQAKALKEMGIAIPDDVLIENSRLVNRADIVKKIQAANNTPEAIEQRKMQARLLAAQVTKMEGEATEKGTKSGLDQARTGRENAETDLLLQGGDGADQAKAQNEMEIKQQELALKEREMNAKLEFEREKQAQDLQFLREKHAQEIEIRQQEAAAKAEQSRQDGILKRQQMAQQATTTEGKENGNDRDY